MREAPAISSRRARVSGSTEGDASRQLGVGQDRQQDVVEVVRHSPRQQPEAFPPLRLLDLSLEPPSFGLRPLAVGDVEEPGDGAAVGAVRVPDRGRLEEHVHRRSVPVEELELVLLANPLAAAGQLALAVGSGGVAHEGQELLADHLVDLVAQRIGEPLVDERRLRLLVDHPDTLLEELHEVSVLLLARVLVAVGLLQVRRPLLEQASQPAVQLLEPPRLGPVLDVEADEAGGVRDVGLVDREGLEIVQDELQISVHVSSPRERSAPPHRVGRGGRRSFRQAGALLPPQPRLAHPGNARDGPLHEGGEAVAVGHHVERRVKEQDSRQDPGVGLVTHSRASPFRAGAGTPRGTPRAARSAGSGGGVPGRRPSGGRRGHP